MFNKILMQSKVKSPNPVYFCSLILVSPNVLLVQYLHKCHSVLPRSKTNIASGAKPETICFANDLAAGSSIGLYHPSIGEFGPGWPGGYFGSGRVPITCGEQTRGALLLLVFLITR